MAYFGRLGCIIIFCLFVPSLAVAGVPDHWDVPEAYKKGTTWGGPRIVKCVEKMLKLWYPVYWKNGGGADIVTLALTTCTETAHTGNPLRATNDKVLGEAGLLSVKRAIARNYDINACVPAENVWAASKAKNEKFEKVVASKYGKRLNQEDQIFYAGMKGGSGAGAAACILENSGSYHAMSNGWKKSMSLKNKVFSWLEEMGNDLQDEKYDPCWGRINAIIATFRTLRLHATRKIVLKKYGGGKKGKKRWASCVRPKSIIEKKPENFGPYQGDEKHGVCANNPKTAWDIPPPGHRLRGKGKKQVDLWMPYCGTDYDCLSGKRNAAIYLETVWPNWFNAKQAQGLLPPDEDYAWAEHEIKEAGCWVKF